mmetsp:Transcript_19898/g.54875  ORF Transcript_19898/g.54875 Transcript_19898/m.54875 type:complete len:240 (-) Transcript_19898:243-962(-)
MRTTTVLVHISGRGRSVAVSTLEQFHHFINTSDLLFGETGNLDAAVLVSSNIKRCFATSRLGLFLLLLHCSATEEVIYLIIVDLQHSYFQREGEMHLLVGFLRVFAADEHLRGSLLLGTKTQKMENLLNSSVTDTILIAVRRSLHRECFSAPRLTICEDASIVSIDYTERKGLDVLENALLRLIRAPGTIKSKALPFIRALIEATCFCLAQCFHHRFCALLHFGDGDWTNTTVHLNVSL